MDQMDMRTILAWRHTCHDNYSHTCVAFRRRLKDLLKLFFPCTAPFLRALSDCQGVLGGEFALAYILRDWNFLPSTIDVFLPEPWFHIFLETILLHPLMSTFFTSLPTCKNTVRVLDVGSIGLGLYEETEEGLLSSTVVVN